MELYTTVQVNINLTYRQLLLKYRGVARGDGGVKTPPSKQGQEGREEK